MADSRIEVQKLYVAYFNRPADTGGMDYWTDLLDTNPDALADVSRSFAASAEYRDVFAGMDNRAIVNEVYQNLFGRTAEDSGLNYWADLLDRKVITIDDVVLDIAEGAKGSDNIAFNGKIAGALLFTDRLDEPHEVTAYAGDEAIEIASQYLATIKDASSALEALDTDVVDAWIERIAPPHQTGVAEVALVGVQTEADPLPVV